MLPRHFALSVTSIQTLNEAYDRASEDETILKQFIDNLVNILCRDLEITLLMCLAEKIGWEEMIAAVTNLTKSDDLALYLRSKELLSIFRTIPELKTSPGIALRLRKFEEILNEALYRLDDYVEHVESLSQEDANIFFRIYAIKFKIDTVLQKIRKQFTDHEVVVKHFESLVEGKSLTVFAKTLLLIQYLDDYQPLTYTDGLLSCAQIANRKKRYDFNPTVINNISQFSDYIQAIVDSHRNTPNLTIHERFLYVSAHWVCGEIRVESEGKVQILLSDPVSLGKSDDLSFDTPKLIYALNQAFPGHPVYFPIEKRQYDLESCCIYAIDDLTHFYTISQYIGMRDLFEYFEKQNAKNRELPLIKVDEDSGFELEKTKITFTPVKLPLAFMRTIQSSILTHSKVKQDVIIPSILSTRTPEEIAKPVNKKGQDIRASIHGIFKKNKFLSTTENMQLAKKIKSIRIENALYVATHSLLEIHTAMKKLTLDSLVKKLTDANQKSERLHIGSSK